MEIVIIGSGNAAAVLGRKFKAAGHNILQVVSRNASAASELAYEWDTVSTNYQSPISKEADVYLIAITDGAIDAVVEDLRLPGKVVAHTAASVSIPPPGLCQTASEPLMGRRISHCHTPPELGRTM